MNDRHLVLHGLAIKKHAAPRDVAELIGLSVDVVAKTLAEAEGRGRVARVGDRFMLTAAAQMALRAEYSQVYSDLRADATINAAYVEFESVNQRLKQLITDWQTIAVAGERVRNDHSNAAHDQKTIDTLGALHERAVPILNRMTQRLPRLSVYPKNLTIALEKAEDGDVEWVSDAKIASYHTVWFELHEDLLRILGRERKE
jgi:predicted transcriptional regulator of viral defense system